MIITNLLGAPGENPGRLDEVRVPWGLGLPSASNTEIKRRYVVQNYQRGVPALEEKPPHDRTAIIACYGPSLASTIEELRNTNGDIFTVSGAHDFLIQNNIVPKAHVEIDPRIHKVFFLNNTREDVTYYLSSSCHPQMFDKAKNSVIFNLFSYEPDDDAFFRSVQGPNAFCLDAGCQVGLAAMTVAYCLGYRRFDIFGMDCSRQDGQRHAGPHSGPPQRKFTVRIKDRVFDSSPQMVAGAQDFFNLAARLGDCSINVHGDGLLQYWIDQSFELAKEKYNAA